MSVAKLLLELKTKQIDLRLDGDDLEIASYGEELTPDLIERLSENKAGLVELLKEAERQKDYVAIPKAEEQDSYTMSPGQRRLYVLQQMNDVNIGYNMPIQLVFDEPMNIDRVEKSLQQLVQRHESLRTVFRVEDIEPRQYILNDVDFCLDRAVAERSELAEIVTSFVAPFDLEVGSLFRALYVSVTDGSDLLLIDMHHIITDGVSQEILEREFWQLYSGEELLDQDFQYRDYSEWVRSDEQQSQLEAQKSYWLDCFSGELPVLELPYDFRRPSVKNYEGSRCDFTLSEEDLSGLRRLCDFTESTLYMGLLTVISTWLWKLSGQKDIVVGSPIAARRHSDLEGIMGMFVNTLAIRTELDGNLRFSEVLSLVKSNTLGAYAHQEYGFEELVEQLKLTRDTSRNPLFDVMLVLQNQSGVDQANRPYRVEEVKHAQGQSKFDLSLDVHEKETGLYVTLSYSTQLFKAETIERFVAYFQRVIASLNVSDPVLSKLSVLSEEEQQYQLDTLTSTSMAYAANQSVVSMFGERVLLEGSASALLVKNRSFSYAELDAGSNGVANYLLSEGIGAGDRVGVLLGRDERLIMSLLGVLKSGAAYVPIDPSYPQDRIDYLLSDSACRCIIDDKLWAEGLVSDTSKVDVDLTPSQLAYVIYTSGSTGKPKGVMITHGNLSSFLHWSHEEFKEELFDLVYAGTSVCFDLSIFELFYSLTSGTPIRLLESALDMEEWLALDRNVLLNTVPSVLGGLLKGDVSLSNVTVLNLAGEPIPRSYIDQLDCNQISVRNLYGPSEDTTYSTCYKLSGDTEILIGRPIGNAQAYVLDEWNNLMPYGSIGELCLSGSGLSQGYLNRESLTAEKFIEHPFIEGERLYKTGDLVQWTTTEELRYIGRKDDQVKLRGYRIELGEIEHCINKHNSVEGACIVIHEYGTNDKTLVAFVSVTESFSEEGLLAELKVRLPHYMIPDHIVQVDEIPVNSNGKTDRRKLLMSLETGALDSGIEYVEPETEGEKKIVHIWEELLEKDPIGMQDDFFRAGGHSLKVTSLSNLIYREWGVVIPFQKFFSHTTPAEQLALILSEDKSAFHEIEEAPERELHPLSAAQKRLYFMQELAPESTAYNMPTANYLGKEVDADRMEQVIRDIIQRHEILRTSFVKMNDEPYQKINEVIEFKLDRHTCRYEELPEYLDQYLKAFSLDDPSLLRSSVVEVEELGYVWVIDMHHIVADGTSLQNLTSEFIRLYNGKSLQELPIQYKDFSNWQNMLIENGVLEEQKKWWLDLYAELPPRIDLPTDYKRPTTFTFEGDYVRFALDQATTDRLKNIATERKGTLQMVLLSVLNTLLHKYTGQNDIVVGCGIAGRQHPDLKDLVGMFVNTLAIRNYPDSKMTWEELFAQVKENSIQAYKNQDLQFEELVDLLGVDREPSRNPMLDVCLVVQNFDKSKEDISLLIDQNAANGMDQNSLMKLRSGSTAKFDMTWFVEEKGGQIEIQLEYYTAIFSRETIERMSGHFLKILDEVLEKPGVALGALQLLEEQEEQKILKDFVRGKHVDLNWETSIPELFSEQAKKFPDNVAVSDKNGQFTYAELEKESNQLARFLRKEIGVEKESIIGVLHKRDRQSIVAILAVLKTGGAFLLLEETLPEERLVLLVSDAQIQVILTSKDLVGLANRLQWRGSGGAYIVCTDSDDIYKEHGGIKNELTSKDLWEYVGNTATDLITAGGWLSSYDGEAISELEMEEYSNNAYQKVKGVLTPESRVLEVGCSSGLTMFQVAPNVAEYVGTDLSSSILEITAKEVEARGADNIQLACMPAHEIDQLSGSKFDLVVINSVIQCFEDHNYLRNIISKAVDLLQGKGHIFIGDVMDEDQREEMIDALVNHAKSGSLGQTKIDFSSELFVSKEYFTDLVGDGLGVADVTISDKIFTIHNELTDFRFDALLTIDSQSQPDTTVKKKFQLDRRSITKYSDEEFAVDVKGDNLCYSFFTSGSTGKPKGVMIEHASLHNLCNWYRNYFDLNEKSVASQYASMSFDAFVFETFPPLLCGAELTFIPGEIRLEMAALVDFLHDKNVTHSFLPTPIYEEIDTMELLEPLAGKTIVVAGDQLKEVKASGIQLYNSYGPTENTVATTVLKVNTGAKGFPPIGKPIDNIDVFILNDRKEILPVGVVGEIWVSGRGLARGYMNSPTLNKEKFIPNPFAKGTRLYSTGDLGKWTADGNIDFAGRLDDQVKIRGNRIELGEIENCLLSLNEISAAVAIVKTNDFGEKELAAYFVASEKIDKLDIQNFIRKLLPEYMVPSHLYQLERLPLTKNGKLDKKKLVQMAKSEDRRKENFVPLETETEHQLAGIWSDLLGISSNEISANDHFFQIGGHSLKATRLSSQIHKLFSVKIELKELFRVPELAKQAKLIESASTQEFQSIPTVEESESYVLSSSQRRLWVLSQIAEANSAYNISQCQVFRGDLDLDILNQAFKEVIRRHESLRTIFKSDDDGDVRQFIVPFAETTFSLTHEDVRDLEMMDEYVQSQVRHESELAFDLEKAPLIRGKLFQTEEHEYVFCYTLHHIISDGWSMDVLFSELLENYQALKEGRKTSLDDLKIQYKDYAAWQQNQLEEENIGAHRTYWTTVFSDTIPVLSLPTQKARPSVQSYDGDRVETVLAAKTTSQLKKQGQEHNASLFMTLLAGLNVLLYKYSGDTDIVVGTPIAGRNHSDLEEQIGFYVNTLPLRVKTSGDTSFSELLKTAVHASYEAFEHQVYPFDDLVNDLSLKRDLSRNPLFDVVLAVQSESTDVHKNNVYEKTGLQVEDYKDAERIVSKFDLTFNVLDSDEGLQIGIDFNTALFDRSWMQSMLSHFERILTMLSEDLAVTPDTIDFLSPEEKDQLLALGAGESVELPQCNSMLEAFELCARNTPNKEAIVTETGKLSYAELNQLSNKLASCFREEQSIAQGDVIGIKLNRSEWLIASQLAVFKSGGAFVPIDPGYPQERIDFMLENSGCKFLIDDKFIRDFEQKDFEEIQEVSYPTRGDAAYVVYTSGSTGKPKGVVIEHGGLLNLCNWHNRTFEVTPEDNASIYAGVGFDAAIWEVFPYLCAGARLVVVPDEIRMDTLELNKFFEEKAVSIAFLPTKFAESFFKEDNTSLRYLLVGGDALASLVKTPYTVVNNYGPSEATVVTTSQIIAEGEELTIGRAIDNMNVYILEEGGQLAPFGVNGEICIGGLGLAREYMNQYESVQSSFAPNPFKVGERLYRTGDVGRWTESGNIHFAGRQDDQVSIRGYRIELGEIEHVLCEMQAIDEGVILCQNEVLIAVYVADETVPVSEIKAQLKSKLPLFMVPEVYVQRSEFPLTSNGKIDRKRLAEEVDSDRPGSTFVAPESETEKELAVVWGKILGVEQVSLLDDFFMIGGNSIKVTMLIAELRKQFDVKVAYADLFATSVLAEQAQLIGSSSQNFVSDRILKVDEQEFYPLSDAQKRLWILDQFEENKLAYNIPAIVWLKQGTSIEILISALNDAIGRHEILRTLFQEKDGEVKQTVLTTESLAFSVETLDLRSESDVETAVMDYVLSATKEPFDLSTGPLIRATLLRVDDDQYAFYYCLHHIVSDGWSMNVLNKDILDFYNMRAGLSDVKPEPLELQYRDYASWQLEQFNGKQKVEEKDYWKDRLSGEIPTLRLPIEIGRPELRTMKGNTLFSSISEAQTQKLKQFCLDQKGSLFIGLLAVWNVVLHKYTHENEFVFGTPVSGRGHSDLQNQIGCYINTIALRNELNQEESFLEFFDRIRANTLNDFANQHYPFDQVLDDLNVMRDRSRNPVFDVMITLDDEMGDPDLFEAKAEHIRIMKENKVALSRFDLDIGFQFEKNHLNFDINYNTDVFGEDGISDLIQNFNEVLSQILTNPDQPIQSVSLKKDNDSIELISSGFWSKHIEHNERVLSSNLHEEEGQDRLILHVALNHSTALASLQAKMQSSRLTFFSALTRVLIFKWMDVDNYVQACYRESSELPVLVEHKLHADDAVYDNLKQEKGSFGMGEIHYPYQKKMARFESVEIGVLHTTSPDTVVREKHPLALIYRELDGNLQLEFLYDKRKLDEATVQMLSMRMEVLIAEISENPTTTLRNINSKIQLASDAFSLDLEDDFN